MNNILALRLNNPATNAALDVIERIDRIPKNELIAAAEGLAVYMRAALT